MRPILGSSREKGGKVEGAGHWHETELITLEVGSRGGINLAGFQFLKAALNSTTREMSELMLKMCKQTIKASHSIWCSRSNPVK